MQLSLQEKKLLCNRKILHVDLNIMTMIKPILNFGINKDDD